jgi:hypothetical protein
MDEWSQCGLLASLGFSSSVFETHGKASSNGPIFYSFHGSHEGKIHLASEDYGDSLECISKIYMGSILSIHSAQCNNIFCSLAFTIFVYSTFSALAGDFDDSVRGGLTGGGHL